MNITFTISVEDYARNLREDLLMTLIYVRDRNHIKEMCEKAGKSRQVLQRRLSYLLRDGLIQREVWPGTDWTKVYILTDLGKEVLRVKHIDTNPDPESYRRFRASRRGDPKIEVEIRTEAYRKCEEGAPCSDRGTVAGYAEGEGRWTLPAPKHFGSFAR